MKRKKRFQVLALLLGAGASLLQVGPCGGAASVPSSSPSPILDDCTYIEACDAYGCAYILECW